MFHSVIWGLCNSKLFNKRIETKFYSPSVEDIIIAALLPATTTIRHKVTTYLRAKQCVFIPVFVVQKTLLTVFFDLLAIFLVFF